MHFTWRIKISVHLRYGCILHGEIAIIIARLDISTWQVKAWQWPTFYSVKSLIFFKTHADFRPRTAKLISPPHHPSCWSSVRSRKSRGKLLSRLLSLKGFTGEKRLIGRRATTWHCQIQNGGNTSFVYSSGKKIICGLIWVANAIYGFFRIA